MRNFHQPHVPGCALPSRGGMCSCPPIPQEPTEAHRCRPDEWARCAVGGTCGCELRANAQSLAEGHYEEGDE